MIIDNEMVDRIAALAYLRFGDEEKEQIRKDLEEILSFIEKLNELDTSDVEPLIFLSETSSPLREDRELPHVDRDQVMRNAPETDGEYFLVPKVIDDKSRGLQ